VSTAAWGLGPEWVQDPADALTFRRDRYTVTFEESPEGGAWLLLRKGQEPARFPNLETAVRWGDFLLGDAW